MKTKPTTTPPARKDDSGVLRQYFAPKPNRMFDKITTSCIRFVRYAEKVPCALCGAQSKKHWTSVVRFRAADLGETLFCVKLGKRYFAAGAPMCNDHLLEPDRNEFLRKARKAMGAAKEKKAGNEGNNKETKTRREQDGKRHEQDK